MSIRKRIREIRARVEAHQAAQEAAQYGAWLESLSEEDLLRLVERGKALRQSTGNPECALTPEEIAETLGITVETLKVQIAPGGTA